MKHNQAFTVVELLTAMAIFSILLAIVVGIFIQSLRSQRILIHLIAINDNTGLVLEQMAREIRSGYDFCDENQALCDTVNFSNLSFFNYRGEMVNYVFNSDAKRVERNGLILTAPDVEVRDLKFRVYQDDNDENPINNICNPWRIVITMEVGSSNHRISQISRLQTTVSSRILPRESPRASEQIIQQCGSRN